MSLLYRLAVWTTASSDYAGEIVRNVFPANVTLDFTWSRERCTRVMRPGEGAAYYVKPRTPQLNGKVERSHRTDREEFYQLLTYTDDVDLNKKLEEWEHFYNFSRPHGAFDGRTPYEALRELIQ